MKSVNTYSSYRYSTGSVQKRILAVVLFVALVAFVVVIYTPQTAHSLPIDISASKTPISANNSESKRAPERTCTKDNVCSTTTYDKQESKISVTCKANETGVCVSDLKIITYDTKGNITSKRECRTVAEDGSCREYAKFSGEYYTYDAKGHKTAHLRCDLSSDGNCDKYSSGEYYTYDVNGNNTSYRECGSVAKNGTCDGYSAGGEHIDYIYDTKGHLISQRFCGEVEKDGKCRTYFVGRRDDGQNGSVDYMYDAQGKRIAYRVCGSVSKDGTCRAYNGGVDYSYDLQGNMVLVRACARVGNDGACQAYLTSDEYEPVRIEYTYDEKGNRISERECDTIAKDGKCSPYTAGTDYKYDIVGNKISERYCSKIAKDGKCSNYHAGYDYAYDEKGNLISKRHCDMTVRRNPGGLSTYTYDNENNQVSEHVEFAKEVTLDAVTGACILHNLSEKSHKYN